MDDGTFGSLENLKKAFNIISSDGPSEGLLLIPSKCSIWVGKQFQDIEDPTGFGIPKADPRGIQLLDSPIGSDDFMLEVVNKRISDVEDTLVSKLSTIANPQVQLSLLRSCLPLPMQTGTLESAYKRFKIIQHSALEDILAGGEA